MTHYPAHGCACSTVCCSLAGHGSHHTPASKWVVLWPLGGLQRPRWGRGGRGRRVGAVKGNNVCVSVGHQIEMDVFLAFCPEGNVKLSGSIESQLSRLTIIVFALEEREEKEV